MSREVEQCSYPVREAEREKSYDMKGESKVYEIGN